MARGRIFLVWSREKKEAQSIIVCLIACFDFSTKIDNQFYSEQKRELEEGRRCESTDSSETLWTFGLISRLMFITNREWK